MTFRTRRNVRFQIFLSSVEQYCSHSNVCSARRWTLKCVQNLNFSRKQTWLSPKIIIVINESLKNTIHIIPINIVNMIFDSNGSWLFKSDSDMIEINSDYINVSTVFRYYYCLFIILSNTYFEWRFLKFS